MKATISKDSPRHSVWLHVFGTDTIRVLGPPAPTGPNGAMRILVDLSVLTVLQRQRLAKIFAQHDRIPADRMMSEMTKSGSVPISAENVTVVEEARLF